MALYRIHLSQTVYESAFVELEANSLVEAEDLAMERAPQLDWTFEEIEDREVIASEEIEPTT